MSKQATRRKATNISLDAELLESARALGVNVSRACERGLASQIAETRAQRWLAENAEAIESSNRHVETHGLPLARYRQF
ncbi:MAG: post-segregation antitoxin CcdA [Alphaproteobacteria bacterium HGW-Alphaproteobacteria-16]|nr:MAG: post-segregation antitoxin CcdA [Alphaproteobacteria bacterium HGW-Alphaproteobacteria-16]